MIQFLNANRTYRAIYADPPWPYRNRATRAAAETHYRTMTMDELRGLPVASIAAEDATLFLWATMPILPDALGLMAAWGFAYKTAAFTWIKTNRDGTPFAGLGNYTRSNAELCLLGTRGRPVRASKSVGSVIIAPRQRHSQKPRETRERIVRLCGDVPRIELFARERAEGWDAWGDEI